MTRIQADAEDNPVLIQGGCLITGDGLTLHETASIRIRRGLIVSVMPGLTKPEPDETVVDTHGLLMTPGFINGHAHATIHGPSMPSGSPPISPSEVSWQRNRHLLSGTTSLLNVCGLAMLDERDGRFGVSPIDIHMTSAHTPSSIAAADTIDGQGLLLRHRSAHIEDLVQAGCRVLGEAGGGQTLGGGAQDYRFIPDAIELKTGLRIPVALARQLKEAVLGRHLDGQGSAKDEELTRLLEKGGLGSHLTPQMLRQLLQDTVLRPVKDALSGLHEVADAAVRFGLPAIFHHAAPTTETLLLLLKRCPSLRMIAAHSNHPSFLPEEAVIAARALRALGATIDVSTLDMIETRFRNRPDNLDALIDEGLVDTVSTDYAGGDWDTIPAALQRMTRVNGISLPSAVALATGKVARIFPELFGDRGLIAAGKRADILVTELHNLAKVRHVFIKGRAVVRDGVLLQQI